MTKKNRSKIKKQFQTFEQKMIQILVRMKNQLLNASMERNFLRLQNLTIRRVALGLSVNFIVGVSILLYSQTLKRFLPHLICLTLNIIVTLTIGKKYVETIQFLDKVIAKNYNINNLEMRRLYSTFRRRAFHKLNLILCIIVLTIFLWGIFTQHYIILDLVGCYAVYLVTIVVSISVIGYAEYMWILWFLYRISKCSSMDFNKIAPAYTPFLIKIGILTNHAKWCFFLEGFLYVFEYFILIPIDKTTSLSLKIPDKMPFIITWIVIFIVIIFAFPTIIFIQELLLSKIVNNLKNQRIEVWSKLYNKLSHSETTFPSVSDGNLFNNLINSLIESPDYPVKTQRLGPAIISIATFCLHIITFLNQLPQLRTFFNL